MISIMRVWKLRKSALIALIALIAGVAALFVVWSFVEKRDMYFIDRNERIAFLIDELTTTPDRQQRALDEIVKDENGAFIYLLKYLDDQRPLAHEEALFLNTHPNTFERYFQAGGKRVGETVLRYLCWKTEKCDVRFKLNDANSIKIQRYKIEHYCRENFKDPNLYEN